MNLPQDDYVRRLVSKYEHSKTIIRPIEERPASVLVLNNTSDSEDEDDGPLVLAEDSKFQEIQSFINDEETYCRTLNALIDNFINTVQTDKLNVLDVFGGIDVIAKYHNNTFLPDLKGSRNALRIVTCFIKHKILFSVYYDSYFKNIQNMIFVMCENKNIFMVDNDDNTFKKYENILLTEPNKRIQEYQLFLESLRKTVCKQDGVYHLNSAIASLSNLKNNFQTQERNFRFIISEIVETERMYLEKLKQIVQIIIPHLESIAPKKMYLSSIVGIIPQIYPKQIEFHKCLENCLFDFMPDDIGLCFLQNESTFRLYVKDQAKKHNINTIEEFKDILKNDKQLNIDFHAPLNRLIKYKLLLQNLKEACVKAEVSFEQVEKASVMIGTIISDINALAAINSVRDENIDLEKQGRLLCRNEFLVQYRISENDKTEEYPAMVFLFEKAVVFTEIKAEGSTKRIVDVYLYKSHIIIKHLGIVAQMGLEKSFQLYFHGRVKKLFHVLCAKDRGTKEQWITTLKEILMDQLIEKKKSMIVSNHNDQVYLHQ